MQEPRFTPETEHQFNLAIGRIKNATRRHAILRDKLGSGQAVRDIRTHYKLQSLGGLVVRYNRDADLILMAAAVTRSRDRQAIINKAVKA